MVMTGLMSESTSFRSLTYKNGPTKLKIAYLGIYNETSWWGFCITWFVSAKHLIRVLIFFTGMWSQGESI